MRWVFNFVEKNRDAGIDKVAKEVKEVFRARYGQKIHIAPYIAMN